MMENSVITIEYYNNNADQYISQTRGVNFLKMQEWFLKFLPSNSSLLDLGCGSGRDSKFFINRGYSVTALDGSVNLCKAAEKFIGQKVICKKFSEIDFDKTFDGIWACASLLHVPLIELNDIFMTLCNSLKPGGIIYASFKYGEFEGIKDGRYFTYINELSIKSIIKKINKLKLVSSRISYDVRPNNRQQWVNFIIKKI